MLLFAILGSITGAARQIAHNVALGVALVAARPLGTALGPKAASLIQGPLLLGTVAAALVAFIVIFVAVRYVLTAVLRQLLSGKTLEDRGLDRTLGFLLGGLKIAFLAYVLLSGLAFVEENVTVAGRRLGLSPHDSIAFSIARTHNLFQYTQFSGVKELVSVASATQDPQRLKRLQEDPAFKALRKDARFQQAMKDAAMQRAIESGDYRALLRSNAVLQLLQDPVTSARISAAAQAGQRVLGKPSGD